MAGGSGRWQGQVAGGSGRWQGQVADGRVQMQGQIGAGQVAGGRWNISNKLAYHFHSKGIGEFTDRKRRVTGKAILHRRNYMFVGLKR